jgi:hypothetical protein
MAGWHVFFLFEARQIVKIVSSGLTHPTQKVQIQKRAPIGHYFLHGCWTVTPDWMGIIAL